MNDIICVQTYPNRVLAEIAKSRLDSAKIVSHIEADDAGGAYPFPLSGHMKGVRLLINTKDSKIAKEILKI